MKRNIAKLLTLSLTMLFGWDADSNSQLQPKNLNLFDNSNISILDKGEYYTTNDYSNHGVIVETTYERNTIHQENLVTSIYVNNTNNREQYIDFTPEGGVSQEIATGMEDSTVERQRLEDTGRIKDTKRVKQVLSLIHI